MKELSVELAIGIQRAQLRQWKEVLKPSVFSRLEKMVTANNKSALYAEDVLRGDAIGAMVHNSFMPTAAYPKEYLSTSRIGETPRYLIQVESDGRDTYPNNFKCKVVIEDLAQPLESPKRFIRRTGYGKFIGNFSPIWVELRGKRVQLTELDRVTLNLEEVEQNP